MTAFMEDLEEREQRHRCELSLLNEELIRQRVRREAAEKEAELLMEENIRLKREVHDLRKQVQSWADEADKEIQLANLRRAEVEAYEL